MCALAPEGDVARNEEYRDEAITCALDEGGDLSPDDLRLVGAPSQTVDLRR
jgi:hypothetical protein